MGKHRDLEMMLLLERWTDGTRSPDPAKSSPVRMIFEGDPPSPLFQTRLPLENRAVRGLKIPVFGASLTHPKPPKRRKRAHAPMQLTPGSFPSIRDLLTSKFRQPKTVSSLSLSLSRELDHIGQRSSVCAQRIPQRSEGTERSEKKPRTVERSGVSGSRARSSIARPSLARAGSELRGH